MIDGLTITGEALNIADEHIRRGGIDEGLVSLSFVRAFFIFVYLPFDFDSLLRNAIR